MTQEERQQKFELMLEGFGLPSEVKIYKSTTKFIISVVTILFFVLMLGFSTKEQNTNMPLYIFLLLFILAGLAFIIFKTEYGNKPQIILSTDGIYTPETDFIRWEDIQNEHITYHEDYDSYTLSYRYPKGIKEITISGYTLEPHDFFFYIEKYRQLHNIKKSTFNL